MYEANTVLVCDGLETGQARDVHGQVRSQCLTWLTPTHLGHDHNTQRSGTRSAADREVALPCHGSDRRLLSARIKAPISALV